MKQKKENDEEEKDETGHFDRYNGCLSINQTGWLRRRASKSGCHKRVGTLHYICRP